MEHESIPSEPDPSLAGFTVPPVSPEQPPAVGADAPVSIRPPWAKAAFAGGLVGALFTSAALGGVIVATRDKGGTKAAAPVVQTVDAKGTAKPTLSFAGATLSVADVLKAVEPAVVALSTQQQIDPNSFFGVEPSQGAGTGIVLTPDGYILTNAHVIEGAATIKVTFSDRKVRSATVIGRDRERDIALVKVDGAKFSAELTGALNGPGETKASYTAELGSDGALHGEFHQAGLSAPFVLQPAGAAQVHAAP